MDKGDDSVNASAVSRPHASVLDTEDGNRPQQGMTDIPPEMLIQAATLAIEASGPSAQPLRGQQSLGQNHIKEYTSTLVGEDAHYEPFPRDDSLSPDLALTPSRSSSSLNGADEAIQSPCHPSIPGTGRDELALLQSEHSELLELRKRNMVLEKENEQLKSMAREIDEQVEDCMDKVRRLEEELALKSEQIANLSNALKPNQSKRKRSSILLSVSFFSLEFK